MIQDNPFADLIPGGAPQPMAPPAQQQAPGVIFGRPKRVDPLDVNRDIRDEARLDITQQSEARSQDRWEYEQQREDQRDDRVAGEKGVERESKLRGEFDSSPQVKRFLDIRAARNQIRTLANGPGTPQDDIGLIFSYMRMLDPASVVRESEFATAQNAAGVPEVIRNQYNKVLEGNRLSPQQRQNMAGTAERLYSTERETYNTIADRYRTLAERQGIQPDFVARRFVLDRDNPDFAERYNKREGGDIAARPVALTGENIVDFMSGLSGGQYDINEDGSVNYNGQPVEVGAGIANSDEFRAAYQQRFGRLPPIQVDVEGGEVDPAALATERGQGNAQGDRLDAFIRGVADVPTMGMADEIAAAGQTLFGSGTMAQNLQAERNVDRYDEQNNAGFRIAGQLGGGALLPIGAARTPGELARVGAAYGGGYGFGSTDGGIGDRLVGGAGGAALGGSSAYGLARLGQAAAGRFGGGGGPGGGNPAGRELMEAAQRQGITPLPADVGGPMTRRVSAAMVQTPFGSGPIINAANRVQEQAGGRLSAIAAAEGAPIQREALGELAQEAAQGYIERTGAVARRGYDQARELAGNNPLRGERAVASIDNQLSELAATSNTDAPLINGLQRLRADLANEGGARDLSIDAIRRLRTSTRAEAMSDGLRGTDYQRRAGKVLDALSEDIAAQLPNDAAAAFRRQDAAYRERLNTIDDVMQNVIGRRGDRSAEAVANRLTSMTRGDSARLRSFLNAVEPEEAGIIRGSLIQAMGRATKGQQDNTGDAFSLQTFLSNWSEMPERTKGLLFRGENRQAIEDLARVATGVRESSRFANTSNSGGAINVLSALGGFGSMGTSLVAENLTGRLLASQRFGQWLARAPRDPARRETWVRRLGTIAAREPAIAQDIAPLQQALQQSLRSAAAEPSVNEPQNRR